MPRLWLRFGKCESRVSYYQSNICPIIWGGYADPSDNMEDEADILTTRRVIKPIYKLIYYKSYEYTYIRYMYIIRLKSSIQYTYFNTEVYKHKITSRRMQTTSWYICTQHVMKYMYSPRHEINVLNTSWNICAHHVMR